MLNFLHHNSLSRPRFEPGIFEFWFIFVTECSALTQLTSALPPTGAPAGIRTLYLLLIFPALLIPVWERTPNWREILTFKIKNCNNSISPFSWKCHQLLALSHSSWVRQFPIHSSVSLPPTRKPNNSFICCWVNWVFNFSVSEPMHLHVPELHQPTFETAFMKQFGRKRRRKLQHQKKCFGKKCFVICHRQTILKSSFSGIDRNVASDEK